MDCSAEDFVLIGKKVSESENPFDRTEEYNRWARKSAYVAYENLSNFVRDRKSFSWSGIREFPLEGLLKHFRFKLDFSPKDFENQFKTAAKELLLDEGTEETLNRFSRFPISMPSDIIGAFNNLPVDERKILLEKFKQNWLSPVNKLQYINLALQSLPDDDEVLENVKEEISFCLSLTKIIWNLKYSKYFCG